MFISEWFKWMLCWSITALLRSFLILFHVGMGHVRGGTVFQEKLDHLLVAFFGGYAQRAGSCFIMGIYVESAINRLERRLGKELFYSMFKSITCDSGVEFQNFEGIEKSVFSKSEKRTGVYFAHPYSSFERGSNENANRLIRRFLPKGTTFDKLRQRDVQRLALWMNKNPRKILDGMSAKDKAKELGLDFYPAKS